MGFWGCCREHWRHRCEMGSELSSVPLLGAPHVASSRHGAMDPACWEHRLQGVGHTSKSISHSLGRSLLAVPHSSCSQAHSNPPGLQLEHLKFPLAPIVWAQFSASTPRLLSLPPSLPLSASTSNELLIAAHPIKGLLHVNNSWLWLAGRLCSTRAGAWVNGEE